MLHPTTVTFRDRVRGCLLGTAIGDALGAPFEGYWPESIPDAETLLDGFQKIGGYPLGQFTDDTQLTIATVRAMLATGDLVFDAIAAHIADLWESQTIIGPGGACTRAAWNYLKSRDWQTCGAPIGQAGNGTAMRTAILGAWFFNRPDDLPEAVGHVSRITHSDPRSIAGGIAIAKAAQLFIGEANREWTADDFCDEIANAMAPTHAEFAGFVRDLPKRLAEPVDVALDIIAWSGQDKPELPGPIITPFVVPTVLAALWVILRFPNSWPDAVTTAIQLGGDTDTVGAIVGGVMGARLGVAAIPAHLRQSAFLAAEHDLIAAHFAALIESRAG